MARTVHFDSRHSEVFGAPKDAAAPSVIPVLLGLVSGTPISLQNHQTEWSGLDFHSINHATERLSIHCRVVEIFSGLNFNLYRTNLQSKAKAIHIY